MTTLTKEQKIEAYTYAMLCIVANEGKDRMDFNNIWPCVCDNLDNFLEESFDLWTETGKGLFPEFFIQKPEIKNFDWFWWPIKDIDSRLNALARAIALVESGAE